MFPFINVWKPPTNILLYIQTLLLQLCQGNQGLGVRRLCACARSCVCPAVSYGAYYNYMSSCLRYGFYPSPEAMRYWYNTSCLWWGRYRSPGSACPVPSHRRSRVRLMPSRCDGSSMEVACTAVRYAARAGAAFTLSPVSEPRCDRVDRV